MTYDENQPHVNVNGEWIPTSKVEFMDIEEDLRGYDVMTFRYQNEIYRSFITYRPVS